MNFHLSRTARARVYLAILQATNSPDDPVTPYDFMVHGYAQAITSEYPEDCFELSRKIDAFVAGKLHGSGFQFATVNPSAPNEDAGTVSIALKLAGFIPGRVSGGVRWTDAVDHQQTLHISLPDKLDI